MNSFSIPTTQDNTITFQRKKGKSWNEYGKITLPAPFNRKLDSTYKLKISNRIIVSILIPNHESISCFLYYGKNNNGLYYQLRIPKKFRTPFIKHIADKKDFVFHFDLETKEVKIK